MATQDEKIDRERQRQLDAHLDAEYEHNACGVCREPRKECKCECEYCRHLQNNCQCGNPAQSENLPWNN